MLQVAIIGLGSFGISMLEELQNIQAEVIIIDRSQTTIDNYKSLAKDAYITDSINDAVLKKTIPQDIDAVIVDLDDNIEASILTTNNLKKLGIKKIIARADNENHGEILSAIGATRVVFPDKEAAKKMIPTLVSTVIFNYMHLSDNLSLAEVKINENILNKTLFESKLREEFNLNVIAYRDSVNPDFKLVINKNFKFTEDMILLVAGTDEDILQYSNKKEINSNTLSGFFKSFFPHKTK
ncbi:MAG: potassium channel family protein [Treponemataceae bacterium]